MIDIDRYRSLLSQDLITLNIVESLGFSENDFFKIAKYIMGNNRFKEMIELIECSALTLEEVALINSSSKI